MFFPLLTVTKRRSGLRWRRHRSNTCCRWIVFDAFVLATWCVSHVRHMRAQSLSIDSVMHGWCWTQRCHISWMQIEPIHNDTHVANEYNHMFFIGIEPATMNHESIWFFWHNGFRRMHTTECISPVGSDVIVKHYQWHRVTGAPVTRVQIMSESPQSGFVQHRPCCSVATTPKTPLRTHAMVMNETRSQDPQHTLTSRSIHRTRGRRTANP